MGMRRVDPTHRWRGGRVAEGGGLLNRYTVNTVSGVRIPSSPPDRFEIIDVLSDPGKTTGFPRLRWQTFLDGIPMAKEKMVAA